MFKHSFYINDLDSACSSRTSAINIIENIVNKAYKKEMNNFVDVFKKIQMLKKPKVFCFSLQKKTKEVMIDRVSLKTIKSIDWEIIAFKSPSFDSIK